MGSNNFDGPILLDTLSSANYFGFGRAAGTEVSSGPRVMAAAASPPASAAPAGSIQLASDGRAWINTDGLITGWAPLDAFGGAFQTITATDAVDPGVGIVFVDLAGAAPCTITLPDPAGAVRRKTIVLRRGSAQPGEDCIVATAGGAQIEGVATVTLPPGGRRMLYSDGANWYELQNSIAWQTGVNLDPGGAAAANTTTTYDIAVPGVRAGDRLFAWASTLDAGLVLTQAHVIASDTVRIRVGNLTAAPIDPGALAFQFQVFRNQAS